MPPLPAELLVVLVVLLGGGLLYLALRSTRAVNRSRRRLDNRPEAPVWSPPGARGNERLWDSWLEGWLHRAGLRSPGVVGNFILVEIVSVLIGGIVSLLILRAGAFQIAIEWLAEIPGGIGDFLAPAMHAGPVTIFVLGAAAPVLVVRARRRELVNQVERDLPMALALLSTLVESGLGFDAAVERLLQALDPSRPLPREFLLLRSELQAGVDRVRCFRRMASRLQVPSAQVFVSAMVHSEQVGGGVAASLRRQADEVWNRRREQAIAKAQVMPTRLAIPLTLCFLPGIFVYTFGPALAQFLEIAESVVPAASP